jgi:hypothetical protein
MGLRHTSAIELDPTRYERHSLHGNHQAFVEKNCYVDVWIEVVHALGLDPLAMMPFTLTADFETDQWTFLKPPADDLERLYGILVNELNIWRPLGVHAIRHLADGKLIVTEADAFFLPDVEGTDYRRQHVKSTIVIASLDLEQRQLGYFHNGGYFTLDGDDFTNTFRMDGQADPRFLPLFVEYARIDRIVHLSDAELASRSLAIARKHYSRRPSTNPFTRFRPRLEADLEWLKPQGLGLYHAYAFATLRQLGAGFELASQYCDWLSARRNQDRDLLLAAKSFAEIAAAAKVLVLKCARAVSSNRPIEIGPMVDSMETGWQRGMDYLGIGLG